MPSVLWQCWLDVGKSIRPVKNWVMRCWHGYLSGARKWFAYGPADATAILSSLASLKSGMVSYFWCWLTHFVLEKKKRLNVCLSGANSAKTDQWISLFFALSLYFRNLTNFPQNGCSFSTSNIARWVKKGYSYLVCRLIMATLWYRAGHNIFALWFLSSFFPRLISAATDWMSTILPHMVWP